MGRRREAPIGVLFPPRLAGSGDPEIELPAREDARRHGTGGRRHSAANARLPRPRLVPYAREIRRGRRGVGLPSCHFLEFPTIDRLELGHHATRARKHDPQIAPVGVGDVDRYADRAEPACDRAFDLADHTGGAAVGIREIGSLLALGSPGGVPGSRQVGIERPRPRHRVQRR